jgi:hypothetical protein
VQVESLFIDEGFGSLDADSLLLAMDALDKLQAQGRKVGVISHVHEMTERIGGRAGSKCGAFSALQSPPRENRPYPRSKCRVPPESESPSSKILVLTAPKVERD